MSPFKYITGVEMRTPVDIGINKDLRIPQHNADNALSIRRSALKRIQEKLILESDDKRDRKHYVLKIKVGDKVMVDREATLVSKWEPRAFGPFEVVSVKNKSVEVFWNDKKVWVRLGRLSLLEENSDVLQDQVEE